MSERIRLREAVVVEGKYDVIRLSSLLDCVIIKTDGFRIFKDKELLTTLRTLAKTVGLVVITDSDSAGFKIRNHLKGAIKEGSVKHVYIPKLEGKERRKATASAEGTLGVEGMDTATLLRAFEMAGVTTGDVTPRTVFTAYDLLQLGLNGTQGSKERRHKLLKKLGLPDGLSSTAFAEVLGLLCSYDEVMELLSEVDGQHELQS